MKPMVTVFAGIDAGGSKTRMATRTADPNAATRYSTSPGVNLKQTGMAQAVAQLRDAIHDTLNAYPTASRVIIYAGIAGAGRPADKAALQQRLAHALRDVGEIELTVVTDAELALNAAHGTQSGVLCIAGTGSILMAMTRELVVVRAGGWGRLIGDEAGGFRIGQAALAAVADAFDGGPATQLVAQLSDVYQITTPDALIEFVYDPKSSIQHVAPLVLEAAAQADPVALEIVDDQLALLTNRLVWLLKQHPDIEQRIAFVGGLANNAWFKQRLRTTLQGRLPEMTFVAPAMAPVDAALHAAIGRGL